MIFPRLAIFVLSYFIGSISPGAFFAWLKGIDITKQGSGSSGATNTARSLGWKYFVLVFLIDCLKAFLFLFFLTQKNFTLAEQYCAAIGLLLGNVSSLWLQFRGGKGVATTIGILLALYPHSLFILIPIWLLFYLITRTIGIASSGAFVGLCISTLNLFATQPLLAGLMFFIGALGIYRHIDNMKRYLYVAKV